MPGLGQALHLPFPGMRPGRMGGPTPPDMRIPSHCPTAPPGVWNVSKERVPLLEPHHTMDVASRQSGCLPPPPSPPLTSSVSHITLSSWHPDSAAVRLWSCSVPCARCCCAEPRDMCTMLRSMIVQVHLRLPLKADSPLKTQFWCNRCRACVTTNRRPGNRKHSTTLRERRGHSTRKWSRCEKGLDR